MPRAPQGSESLTEKIAVAVGPSEKLKIQFLAGAAGVSVSEFIRAALMPQVEAEHRRITAMLRKSA